MPSPSQPVPPNPPLPPANAPTIIDTSSPNNVKLWIRKGIVEGRLRDCANLGIHQIETIAEGLDGKQTSSFFVPNCDHRSFISNHSHLSDESQVQFLQWSLHTNPLSCPKNCTFYENRHWVDFKSGGVWPIRNLFRLTQVMLKGYATLPWPTQVTLITLPTLLLILWKSPSWVPQIIALAKALWGK